MSEMVHGNDQGWYKVGVHALGLHLLYLAIVGRVFPSAAALRISETSTTLGALLLVWASLRSIRKRWTGILIPPSVWVAALVMPLVIFCLVLAIALSPGELYRKPLAFYGYFWVLIALGGIREREWADAKRAFRIHAFVGTLVFVGLLAFGYSWDYTSRSSFIDEADLPNTTQSDLSSPLMLSRQLLYSYPIMLLLFPEEKPFWRATGIASVLSMLVWALLSQMRSTLMLGVGTAIAFSIYCWYRANTVRKPTKFVVSLALAFAVAGGVFLWQGGTQQIEVLVSASGQVLDRITGEKVDSNETIGADNVRFKDAAGYIEQLTLPRAVFGDEGDWISSSGLAMHVGHLRYIIYGGLATMIAVWLLVYWQGWRSVLLSRSLPVLAAGSVAAIHSIQAISAGMLDTFPSTAMLFICAGYCWHRSASERWTHRSLT